MYRFYEQFERAKRFLKRIKDQNPKQEYYKDDLLSFFQHAFHLKDWIGHDEELKIKIKDVENEIENTIKNSSNLQICRDWAVGSKHLCVKPIENYKTKIYE